MPPYLEPVGQTLTRALTWTKGIPLTVLVVLCLMLAGTAGAREVTEQEVKAAMVFNFAKFVEWPPQVFPNAQDPLILGILEQEPLAGALDALAGKTVQGRRLVVKKSNRLDDLKKCHLFFASSREKRDLRQILEAFHDLPVLTVTDEADNIAGLGENINLVMQDGRIRFQVNLAAARRSGLKISSQLLKLAIIVGPGE
jgi:hypothetical protein